MTIEEKAKAYDEAKARMSRAFNTNRCTIGFMNEIFPEFKRKENDDEDERIRKAIYNALKYLETELYWDFLDDVDILDAYDWLEKQGEQKSADNVEPKFHPGDWVILNGTVAQILDKQKYGFVGLDIDGKDFFCNYGHTDSMRHWSINDAKDGDVLIASDDSIFLFAGVDDCACKYYVALTTDNYVKINKETKGGYWEASRAVYPATKEQCDLFFQKMADTGYEWDNEKKELKKVEPKFNVGDWIVTDDSFGKIVRHVDAISFNIIREGYVVSDENGLIYEISFDSEHKWHKWTIQDAKDGDILVTVKDCLPFIFKGFTDNFHQAHPVAYCGIDEDNMLTICSGNNWWDDGEIQPATKEQGDLLFQKMKQAGYEWDAEKKELNKQTLKITPKFCIDQLITDNNGTWYKITNIKCLDDWYYEVYDIGENKTHIELCSIIDERFRYVGEIKK